MKLVNLDNPVRYAWFTEQGYRLDASPYLSGAYEARKLLERLSVPKEPLRSLTTGHDGGIYNGPKFRRVYVHDRRYGVPFLGSTDMLEADFSWLPLLRKRDAKSLPYLEVQEGMTLISCSGTVGRTTYVRPDMAGFWSSQDIMKVNPDRSKIRPGYLYAYLRSRFGISMITSAAYGAIIQHIEPHHIADLPVPRLDREIEERIHELVQEAAELRARFQAGVVAATRDLFASAGLPELIDLAWHKQPREIGFAAMGVNATSLRAVNYSARARHIMDRLRSVSHKTLGDICEGGQLSRGPRFKRVRTEPGHGARLVGQRQAFWVRPEEDWIALRPVELAGLYVQDETVMVASRGLVGENSLIGRAIFVTGSWLEYAYTEDFLRVISGDPDIPGAYLFAFLRSEAAFRVLRSMLVGTGPQDIHPELRRQIPVPLCTPADRARIAETVRQAYRDRDEADSKEDEALRLLDEAVREAAR